jgi:hypothetical protein
MPNAKDPVVEAQAEHEAAQKQAFVDAVYRNREAYEAHGRPDDVALMDAQLNALGVTRETAHKGRETATSNRTEKR